MAALFESGVGSASLKSPFYNFDSALCLRFFYWLSSVKVMLDIYKSTSSNNYFELIESLMHQNQTNLTSWNQAAFMMADGVRQIKFVARKVGITEESEFVNIDRITLTTDAACLPLATVTCK
jgi:hypothetical protein